jgi:peptide/nickel transport system ATP-binding protein
LPSAIRTSCRADSASRVNIARALALQPRVVILDEAVSALDKSVEAQVHQPAARPEGEFGLTYIFISHDLNVVRYMSDRVMVMYLGKSPRSAVGPALRITGAPLHARAAVVDAFDGPGPPHRRGGTGRRPPEPDQPASGLPLSSALRDGRADLQQRVPARGTHPCAARRQLPDA